jgi:hypothetical protein
VTVPFDGRLCCFLVVPLRLLYAARRRTFLYILYTLYIYMPSSVLR